MSQLDSPSYHSYEEFRLRTQKLAHLREEGPEPYPHHFVPSTEISSLRLRIGEDAVGHADDAAAGATEEVTVAGRLVLFRAMGQNAFATLQSDGARLQIMLNRKQTQVEGLHLSEETPLKWIERNIDLGDWIGVQGRLFRTQKGELTILVHSLTLLCKSLLPLPEKHAGLQDKGVRYRKRWLDLIGNPEARSRFVQRARILQLIRQFCADRSFLEVETPILQNQYGGAAARPFTSHLNALGTEMYLRISLEPSLKKLLVGGMERIFELGRCFRNEGMDKTHNPEFTMFEGYAAFWDYHDMMRFMEELTESLCIKLHGTTVVPVRLQSGEEVEIDFKAPWTRMTMTESLQHYAQLDVTEMNDEQLRARLAPLRSDPSLLKGLGRGLLIQECFEEFVEPHLIQPHHILDHPIETTPLCKPHRLPQLRAEGWVERFESFVAGNELANAYSELNDPELQRQLLERQAAARDAGDAEAAPMDEEFVEAICQGMPPAGGLGFGVDRLVMLLTQAESIRDVLLFPLMRPEES